MARQITNTILMIRPHNFGYNEETAVDNAFQSSEGSENKNSIRNDAIEEFDQFVVKLKEIGVEVIVIEDTDEPVKCDAVFPNNWISFHENGWIITYPMFSKIRRLERREDIVDRMMETYGFNKRYSFESYEEDDLFLEGTGSLVLDRKNRIAYANLSTRTDVTLLDKWAILSNYRTSIFNSVDRNGNPIYHTNVLMALGKDFVVICMDSIKDSDQKNELLQRFDQTGKKVIEISFDQMESFAGNMLQVRGNTRDYLIMSSQAYNSLEESQIDQLNNLTNIVHSDISTIEKYGGGSVRCMIAEVFVPSEE